MTPSNDNQPDSKPDKQDFDRTVKLLRCNKHGISFYMGDTCPECDKESKPAPKDAASR